MDCSYICTYYICFQDIAVTDGERLQNIIGMKLVKNTECFLEPWKERLLLVSTRFQKIATNTQNLDEINFRILTAPVNDLVRGTVCAVN